MIAADDVRAHLVNDNGNKLMGKVGVNMIDDEDDSSLTVTIMTKDLRCMA
jgi:hypothetical protein